MAREIERKFLVCGDGWRAAAVRCEAYAQGYLAGTARASIRVRVAADRAWLNIKSATLGIVRQEFEYEIPVGEGRALLALCEPGLIEKRRHFLSYGGLLWEVDEFGGDNAGLVLAEVELASEDQVFERPPWLGEEVSHDPRYYNVWLAKHPFRSWGLPGSGQAKVHDERTAWGAEGGGGAMGGAGSAGDERTGGGSEGE